MLLYCADAGNRKQSSDIELLYLCLLASACSVYTACIYQGMATPMYTVLRAVTAVKILDRQYFSPYSIQMWLVFACCCWSKISKEY